jgi:hypothetical protein
MSALHSVKCLREEAIAFKNKVKTFLDKEKLPYTKILALRCYDGQVKVFTGDTMSKMRIRQGRKLVAFKNPDGSYEGETEAIERPKETGGSQLWLRTSEPIPEKEYLPVFRADDWEEEKDYLKEKLTKK